MSLNRREMLRLGAAGAGSVMLSSAASPNTLPALVFRTPPAAALPIAPPSCLGGQSAMCAVPRRRSIAPRIPRADRVMGIAFFVASRDRASTSSIRRARSKAIRRAWQRSDPECGYLERFSNQPGSAATSNGSYMTADHYQGKYGLSMKVRGLDWSNSNAESRAIVMHNAWYAEPEVAEQHGKLGRSEGCFAFSRENHHRVMSRLSGGALIYADKLSSAYAA